MGLNSLALAALFVAVLDTFRHSLHSERPHNILWRPRRAQCRHSRALVSTSKLDIRLSDMTYYMSCETIMAEETNHSFLLL